MKRVKCIHFNFCVSSDEHLCSDPKCPLNKSSLKKEREEHLESLRDLYIKLKKEKNI